MNFSLSVTLCSLAICILGYALFFLLFRIADDVRRRCERAAPANEERPRWLADLLHGATPIAHDEFFSEPRIGDSEVIKTDNYWVSVIPRRISQRGIQCAVLCIARADSEESHNYLLWLSRAEWRHLFQPKNDH